MPSIVASSGATPSASRLLAWLVIRVITSAVPNAPATCWMVPSIELPWE